MLYIRSRTLQTSSKCQSTFVGSTKTLDACSPSSLFMFVIIRRHYAAIDIMVECCGVCFEIQPIQPLFNQFQQHYELLDDFIRHDGFYLMVLQGFYSLVDQ